MSLLDCQLVVSARVDYVTEAELTPSKFLELSKEQTSGHILFRIKIKHLPQETNRRGISWAGQKASKKN